MRTYITKCKNCEQLTEAKRQHNVLCDNCRKVLKNIHTREVYYEQHFGVEYSPDKVQRGPEPGGYAISAPGDWNTWLE